jgi:nucleoside-diphosphate-sugar epimerase
VRPLGQTAGMRIVVIGGTGHVGTFLVPRLVRAGHDVINISRGSRAPYIDDPAWDAVQQVTVDRDADEARGMFAHRVRDLEADVVIDMLCFTTASAKALVDGLRGYVDHLIHCGSIWRHGVSHRLPMTEDDPSEPFGEYGVQKAAIADLLRAETEAGGLVTTSLHPGHISGPGWPVITPLGNLDPSVWQRLSAGTELVIPGLGAELMHHVHADDVAQAFALAVEHRSEAAGQAFSVTAATALNVRGFAAIAAGWFGRDVSLRSVTWEEFRETTTAELADQSWQHLIRSQCMSIDKARRLLRYEPAYAPEDAAREAVSWLVEHGELQL